VKPEICRGRAATGCGQNLEVEFKVSQGGWEDEGPPLRVFVSRWFFIVWGGTRSLGSVSLGVIMSAASSFAVELIVAIELTVSIELTVAIGFAVANLRLEGLLSVSCRPVEDGFL
jgi:hypothetical protein